MTTMVQDLRFALRQLRRSPGFALTAVLTLALGVSANTAIFSLLDQALLRSLPVREPERLVVLEGTGTAWQGGTDSQGGDVATYFSYPMYRNLLSNSSVFDGAAATSTIATGMTRHGNTTNEGGEIVSGNYFQMLGIQAVLGRVLTGSDDTTPGGNPVVVLSYDFWRDRLGSDPHVVGETISLNRQPFLVVGIAAPYFRSAVWGQMPSLFVPMSMLEEIEPGKGTRLTDHKVRWLNIVGRLRHGLTPVTAQAELAPLWHALRAEELSALGKRSPHFTEEFLTRSRLLLLPGARGLSYSRDGLKKPLQSVMGMAVLVLLIASINVASLLLVRSAKRAREFSVRYALGATARRIVFQLLLEGLLIGLLGAAVGTALAPVAVRVLARQLAGPGNLEIFNTGLDLRLLGFSFAVAIAVSVLFSLAPVLEMLRPNLGAALKQQAGTAVRGRLNLRRATVSLQVGLSVILLIGAGLFARTLQNLRHQAVGFNTEHLLTFSVQPNLAGYTPERTGPLYERVVQSMASLPGVLSAGGTTSAELAGDDSGGNVSVEGHTPPPDDDLDVGRASVTDGYFQTMQMPLVAGRWFTPSDDAQHPPVVIVNQSFARHFFGTDAAAIGKRMARGAGNKLTWMEIVGVSHDTRHLNMRDPAKITDFIPIKQDKQSRGMSLYLRTREEPATVANQVRIAMRQIDPGLALGGLISLDDQIENVLSNERIIGLLATSFGILAALLAGVGLYGVLAYSTAQRTREIGIRIALGSSRLQASGLVVRDVLLLVSAGVAFAIPCAFLLTRLIRSQLFGVSSADPLTLIVVVVTMVLVSLVAAAVPARRAASVDPVVALRSE